MTAWVPVIAIVAGGIGCVVRYLVTLAFSHPRVRLPWGVFVVNVLGSLLGGLLLGVATANPADAALRTILVTGFAGGLTTFSTFSTETVQLLLARRTAAAILSVAGNLVVGVGAAALGWTIGYALG